MIKQASSDSEISKNKIIQSQVSMTIKVTIKLTIIQPRSIAIFHNDIHMLMIDVRIIIHNISKVEELEHSQIIKSAFLGHSAVSIVNANPARFSKCCAQNYNADHTA